MKSDAYIGLSQGYRKSATTAPRLQKKAGIADTIGKALELGVTTSAELIPYMLVLPAIVGGFGGHIHSRITSPSKVDFKTIQKAIELADLRQLESDISRRKQQSVLEEEGKAKPGGSGERALRI